MFLLRERYETIRALWDRTRQDAATERAFHAWCMVRFDAYASAIAAAAVVVSVLLSLGGGTRIPGLPGLGEAFMSAQLVGGAASLLYFLVPRTAFVRQHLVVVYGAITGPTFFFAMKPFADIAGPDSPYVHLWYSIPLWTVPLPMRLRARLPLGVWWAGCVVAGFFLTHPDYWSSPWATQLCIHMASQVAIGVAFGQLVQTLYRRAFLQTQALERHGAILEARVGERTREVSQLAAHLETTQEAERTRIARDLHDDVGQEVAAVRYAVALAAERFSVDPTTLGPNLVEVDRAAARAAASLQGVMAELRPRILDDLGLAAAARWLASRVTERSSLQCEVEVIGTDEAIGPELSAAAFRILQEALMNVMKHSGAQRAKVEIVVDATSLALHVSDDGNGLHRAGTASATRPAGGLGLLAMRERAASLGGAVVIARSSAGGVEVRCHLPLRREPL